MWSHVEEYRRKSVQAMALGTQIVLCCAVLCCAVLCCAVLCCARDLTNRQVAVELHVDEAGLGKWRARIVERRLDGVFSQPCPGAPD